MLLDGNAEEGSDQKVRVFLGFLWFTFMSDGAYELGLDEFAGFPLFFLLGTAFDVCLV